jgi:hypothetical protein
MRFLKENFFEYAFTGDFVRLSFSRPFAITAQTAQELLTTLAAQCSAHSCARVLVEGLAPTGGLTTEELYSLGVALSRTVPGVRVAVFLEGDARDTDRQFFKDVATNRGANVRYFASVDEAKNWLGSR